MEAVAEDPGCAGDAEGEAEVLEAETGQPASDSGAVGSAGVADEFEAMVGELEVLEAEGVPPEMIAAWQAV